MRGEHMKLFILSYLMLSLSLTGMSAKEFKRADKDDGKLATTWLPSELITKIGEKPTMLLAKYEPEEGARYYVLTYSARKTGLSNLTTGFFKVEKGEVVVLGETKKRFPFGKFVEDKKVVGALWGDYLKRWVAQDDKEGVQEKLDRRAGKQITKEEVFYFEKEGFKIPGDVKIVKE